MSLLYNRHTILSINLADGRVLVDGMSADLVLETETAQLGKQGEGLVSAAIL
jgi:hypothetical protein